jgi:RHS repeat-associated protein
VVHRLGAAALLLLGYTLDANGHRTAEVWERPGERVETRYGLDLAERLTSIEVDGRRVVYTLDAVGNRTAEASPEGERIHSYDARDRLVETRLGGVVEAGYGYDAAGRQLSVQRGAQSRSYVYDAEDRLLAVSASGAAPIRYAVDGFGQRRERESGGQVERYQWDGTRLASISNALGNRLADYQHAYGWPISVREGSERRSALADVHGTIQLLTDDTGAIAGHTRTDVWGEVKAQGGEQTRLGHTGYLLDPGITDEQYAQARQYAPGLGRFTSVDPWAGDTLRPITLNKYLYGYGNPGSFVDPDGRCPGPMNERECFDAMAEAIGADVGTREGFQRTAELQLDHAKVQGQAAATVAAGGAGVVVARALVGAATGIYQAYRAGGAVYAATATTAEQLVLAEGVAIAGAITSGAELPPTPLSPVLQGTKASAKALASVEVMRLRPAARALLEVERAPGTVVEKADGATGIAKLAPDSDVPYSPHVVRAELERRYGAGNVISTTVPPTSGKNVRLAGQAHPETGVVFDSRGFPIFDDLAVFDTRLPVDSFYAESYTAQMRMATRDLWAAIQRNEVSALQFTPEQLQSIRQGSARIDGYTWHHHQDTGRMQLVDRDTHSGTGHVGWEGMREGR